MCWIIFRVMQTEAMLEVPSAGRQVKKNKVTKLSAVMRLLAPVLAPTGALYAIMRHFRYISENMSV